jgi:CRISPR-associated protein Csx14
MSESTIPVDLRNPGQVFACLGLVELAEVIMNAPCMSRFNYRGLSTDVTFTVQAASKADPVSTVVRFLRDARALTLIPAGSSLSTKKWDVAEIVAAGRQCECLPPKTPATLPVALEANGLRVVLDHWADGAHSGRDNVKFWAGAGGYPGSALARDMLQLIGDLETETIESAIRAPFATEAAMSSSFRFDWRRDYIPLDAGFSPNDHSDVTMIGYPFTEILAVAGLQYARPARVSKRDKLQYRYAVSSALLPTPLARVVLGAVDFGFPLRRFHMTLGWPGQAGQARCIVDSQEEL